MDLTNLTAAQLADRLFELTGKSLKASSYSKAKFIEMIEAAEAKAAHLHKVQSTNEPLTAADVIAAALLAKQTDEGPVAAEGSEEANDKSLSEMLELAASEDNTFGFTHCPHCGIHHGNGFTTHEDIIEQGGEPNKTHQYLCLGCNGEFGPELETEFTLTEAAASIGISAKVARARYRVLDNDGKRTFYRFPRSDWDRVISIISPKRKK